MIVITGASGALGRLIIDELLRTTPADQIVAAVRSPEKAADLAARGVHVRQADYDRPETLTAALAGARKVLLISGNEIGRRVGQHRAVIDAAGAAGVDLLAYTSLLHADTTTIALAPDHVATEEYLLASGLTYCLLRHGWYSENYLMSARMGVQTGTIVGAATTGRVASAARIDYAAAAATVLTDDRSTSATYELSGDTAWTMPEFAALVAELSGKDVTYQPLSVAGYTQALMEAGLPEPVASIFARNDVSLDEGWLSDTSGALAKLIGRPTTPLRTTLTEALAG